ncbi:MAG: LacI family DNA-binding transcriptional regulator [Ornithinimicrobium sp.]
MTQTDKAPRSTIVDVARAAGVSRQTVSNAVNNPERVRPETLERVLQEIARLNYRASSAAQTLRHQRAGAVGTELDGVTGSPSDVAYPFLVALTIAAPAHSAHLVPFASRESFPLLAGYQDMVRRRLVDAFVLTDTHHGDPRPQWLASEGIPYAAFGRIHDDPSLTSWGDVDGAAGIKMAVAHLADSGYGRIAYLGWPLASSEVGDDRHRGWLVGTDQHGLRRGPSAFALQDLPGAAAAADLLLSKLEPGDAVICASDVLALGVLHALGRRGWLPGRDIGITGFDASTTARRHGITSLAQPLQDIAHHLLGLVHDQLAGAPAPDMGTLFLPTLTVGQSTDTTMKGTL